MSLSPPTPGSASAIAFSTLALLLATPPPASSQPTTVRAEDLRGLKADVITFILDGEDSGSIGVELAARPLAWKDDGVDLGLWIEIASQTLAANDSDKLPVDLHLYAMDPENNVRGFLSQTFVVDLQRVDPETLKIGLRFLGRLTNLAPGDYRLRLLVLQPDTRRFALRTFDVQAPARPTPERPLILEATILEPRGSWLVVEHSSTDRETLDAMAGSAADDFGVSALGVLESGRSAAIRLDSFGLETQAPTIDASLIAADGSSTELALSAPTGSVGADGRRTLRFEIEVPELEPGDYDLRVDLGSELTRRSRVHLVASSDEVVWPQIRRDDAPAERVSLSTIAEQHSASRRIETISTAYTAVLGLLTGGDDADRRLADLESAVAEELGNDAEAVLLAAERGVLERIAEIEPEGLVPLLNLHLKLHRRYLELQRYDLLDHAGTVVQLIAQLYADRATEELGPQLSASALVQLAADLQQARLATQALAALERALALDPRNRLALLSVAIAREGIGAYAEATEALRELLQTSPDEAEARLRLAINLSRTGDSSEASRGLRDLIERPQVPEWILSLAYQELARIYLAQDRLEAAIRLLEAARRRLAPGTSLTIQLAYARDLAGRPLPPAELNAPGRREESGRTPRARYNQRLSAGEGASTDLLFAESLARMPILGRALARI